MNDLERAKINLNSHSICLCKNLTCLYSDLKGIAPILDFIDKGIDLKGYSVADKFVGKAAAILFAKAGIKEVFARIISIEATRILVKFNISFEYETLTEKIISHDGVSICPMEKLVMNIDDPNEGYLLLKEKLEALKKN